MKARGFTLVELLVAMAISAVLLTGMLRIVQAATGGYRLQQALGAVQENARFAASLLRSDLRQAGYRTDPWLDTAAVTPLAPGTADGVNARGDRIAVWRRSNRNCHGTPNPAVDGDGEPLFYLLEATWSVNTTGSLARTCRYGPDPAGLETEIANLGLVEGVESFQALFAEDLTGDGNANRWVNAGQWEDDSRVVGVRFAFLLASPARALEGQARDYQVLDSVKRVRADGRIRRVVGISAAIRSKLP